MKNKSPALGVTLGISFFLLLGCSEVVVTTSGFTENTTTFMKANVQWDNGQAGPIQGNMVAQPRNLASSQIFPMFDQYYAMIGSPINFGQAGTTTGLTPSVFKLALSWVTLMNSQTTYHVWIEPDTKPTDIDATFYADFTTGLSATTPVSIIKQAYTTLAVNFITRYSHRYYTSSKGDYDLFLHPKIVVKIPGYTQTDWPDVLLESQGGSVLDENKVLVYERRCLDETEGIFEFSFDFLQPRIMVGSDGAVSLAPLRTLDGLPSYDSFLENPDGSYKYVRPLDQFVFNTAFTDYAGSFPGYPGEKTYSSVMPWLSSTKAIIGASFGSLLAIPLSAPFSVAESTTEMTVIFTLDTKGIVQVYDNGTPNLKSDDIAVLAKDFWNRMALTIVEK